MDVVICNPLRTPVGRMGGSLSTLTAADLATATLRALIERTALAEGDVDDVVLETMCIGGGQGLAAVFEVIR